MISIETFGQVELKVAEVLAAERVAGTDKLVALQVDLGTERRQLVAGIAPSYEPQELIGKQIVVVANLQPATIRGVESQGMLLAAHGEGGSLSLVTVDRPVANGSPIS